ncbi:XkdQ/YqbQ family protein [Clostridium botulinum]|uniref:XkdQ/YqbQ family protein n=1 Tax=Clostridium botulinum TaxID=1491 RepID=UPI001967FA68|nr:XkdQ [Clostridium botulinum]
MVFIELVLKNKYKIQLLSEEATLKESIDSIAYTLNLSLIETDELKNIGLVKGDSIQLYDYMFNSNEYKKIFDGTIRDINGSKKNKKLYIICRERTVSIEESEEEYLWKDGQTATQRAKTICNDWGIPVGNFSETSIGLSKDLRKESLFSTMKKDLKETAQKGGSLYKFRMSESLDLVELGSNSMVYKLDSIVEDVQSKSSLNGAITQVKVLGKEETKKTTKETKKSNNSEEKELILSPIIGVFKKDTERYGTIQKLFQDEKIDDYSKAKSKADALFSNGEDSMSVPCVQDINTIRAGDKVSLYNNFYYVTDITHELGAGGKMNMTVMSWEGVKTKFYGE